MTKIDVIHMGPVQGGWGPVDRLTQLAATLFEGDVLDTTPRANNRLNKLRTLAEKPKPGKDRGLLVIARSPENLRSVDLPQGLIRNYGFAVAWVIDGFKHAQIPAKWRIAPFDFIGVTRPNDVEVYEKKTGKPVVHLPWGSDALDIGFNAGERPVDLQRVGRQPDAWDDDTRSAATCLKHGLVFAGRVPPDPIPLVAHQDLLMHLARARFVMAHCNLAAPSHYTHPTQAYMTARWTDALAAGCVVAGVPPDQDKSMQVLWPEALLRFDSIDAEVNAHLLAEACQNWTPDIALRNHLEALRRLDWRWRLQAIAKKLDINPPQLAADMTKLSERITTLQAQPQ